MYSIYTITIKIIKTKTISEIKETFSIIINILRRHKTQLRKGCEVIFINQNSAVMHNSVVSSSTEYVKETYKTLQDHSCRTTYS